MIIANVLSSRRIILLQDIIFLYFCFFVNCPKVHKPTFLDQASRHLNVCVGGLDSEAFSSSSHIFLLQLQLLSHVSFHCVFKQICGHDTLIHCLEIAAPLSFSRHMSDNQCTCILFECTQHDNSRGEMQIYTNVFSTLHMHLFYIIEHFFSHGA